jgi:hypothetical protein
MAAGPSHILQSVRMACGALRGGRHTPPATRPGTRALSLVTAMYSVTYPYLDPVLIIVTGVALLLLAVSLVESVATAWAGWRAGAEIRTAEIRSVGIRPASVASVTRTSTAGAVERARLRPEVR